MLIMLMALESSSQAGFWKNCREMHNLVFQKLDCDFIYLSVSVNYLAQFLIDCNIKLQACFMCLRSTHHAPSTKYGNLTRL